MDHVNTWHRQHFFQVVHGARLLDHDGHDNLTQGLHVRLRATIAHIGKAACRHPVRTAVFRRFRADNPHALGHVGG